MSESKISDIKEKDIYRDTLLRYLGEEVVHNDKH